MIRNILTIALFITLLGCQSTGTKANQYWLGEASINQIHQQLNGFAPVAVDADNNALTALKTAIESSGEPLQVKVYFAEWCHDSQREVPRLIALIQKLNSQSLNTWFYALDRTKSDPLNLASQDNVAFTPTVIIYRGNTELGRIIERPNVSWTDDLLTIIQEG